ncbi:hypothetical protein [Loigolactobacillus iwatensis]|uniref:hypothetical protein n=1 Tax=Loigolactobacillus iwatensis TaxID=1267156 RepID=UPI000F7FA7B1|nr:hypothetical protein [Loigolactobacillus iwatensis]
MAKKLNLMKLFPLLLAGGLLIGVISNIVYPQNIKLSGLVIIASTLVWYIWPYFKIKTNQLNKTTISWTIGIGLTLIFIIQLIVLCYLPVTIYHDPFRVLYQAEHLSQGQHVWSSSTYFWRYPNNVPLAFLLSQWFKLTLIFHLSTNTALHLLSLGLLDGFILVALTSIRRFSQQNSGVLAALIFFLISPFAYTYYLQVFYSDLPTLFCLIICFTILAQWNKFSKKNKVLNGIFLFLLILLGQLLKPNLIVFAVAIVILLIVLFLEDRKTLLKYLLPLMVILLGFAATVPARMAIARTVDFTNNSKYQLPTTHWIWMSYNPKGNGTYVGADVKKMTQLPTKTARQNYTKRVLPKRIETLGVRGVVKRWILKAGILLNVSHIQRSYSGGYIEAPKIYQKYEVQLSLLGSLLMRVGFIFIYGLAFIKCLALITKRNYEVKPIRDLAIVLAVGYLAFHVLIWEAESRYGQPLLPLLLLINAFTAQETETNLAIYHQKNRNLFFGGVLLITAFVFATETKPLINGKPMIVAGQRSQLSLQYKAKPTLIQQNTTITQRITLNHTATRLSISVPHQTHLEAKLVSIDRHKRYSLNHVATTLGIKQKLLPGKYEIVLKNTLPSPQKVELVRTQNYELTPHPLLINHQSFKDSSLIYQFTTPIHN